MAESAALLVDDIRPEQPVRQWVLSFPFQLRFLFASNPKVLGRVLGIVYRVLSGALLKKAGLSRKEGMTGAVTLIQRFGSALSLNVHFHMLFVDGVYSRNQHGKPVFRRTGAPDKAGLHKLVNTISHRDRATRKADRIREKLGWEPGILNGEGWRPKGMHWTTFDRLTLQHDTFLGISLTGMAARLKLLGESQYDRV
jgi:hypothetical protein